MISLLCLHIYQFIISVQIVCNQFFYILIKTLIFKIYFLCCFRYDISRVRIKYLNFVLKIKYKCSFLFRLIVKRFFFFVRPDGLHARCSLCSLLVRVIYNDKYFYLTLMTLVTEPVKRLDLTSIYLDHPDPQ